MKKLVSIVFLIAMKANASSGVNCNGMTAGPIWQNSNGTVSAGNAIAPVKGKVNTSQPAQR